MFVYQASERGKYLVSVDKINFFLEAPHRNCKKKLPIPNICIIPKVVSCILVCSFLGKKLSVAASEAFAPLKAVKILILSASHSEDTASQCWRSADSKVSWRVSSITLNNAFSRSFLKKNQYHICINISNSASSECICSKILLFNAHAL